MPERCIDVAKQVHQPGINVFSLLPAVPGCIPAYGECMKNLSGGSDGMYSRFKSLVQVTS